MSTPLIMNARISGAEICIERGFALTGWVYLDMQSGSQGFGGYVLGGRPFDTDAVCAQHNQQKNLAADFIGGVLAVAEVDKWSDLKGKVIRVRKSDTWATIDAIGHPIKDIWYDVGQRMNFLASGQAVAA